MSQYQIKDGTRYIGCCAFKNCSNLVSMTIPNSVTTIESFAFEGCKNMTSFTLNTNLTYFGGWVFSECKSLKDFEVNSNIFDFDWVNTFYNEMGETTIPFNYVQNLIIGPNVQEIVGSSYGWTNLNTIVVDPDNMFYDSRDGCNALIETSSNFLLKGCSSSSIPNTVNAIGEYAFYECEGLSSITIPNSVNSIGIYTFYRCSGLTSIAFPSSLSNIGNYAFYGCSGLSSIDFPNSMTDIGKYAFSRCTGLTSITISNKLTSLEESVFAGCTGLTHVDFQNSSLMSIGKSAFSGCNSLTSIEIPNSVTSIDSYAFKSCERLRKITMKCQTPPTIQSESFPDRTLQTLYVPKGCKSVYEEADYWWQFKEIVEENAPQSTINGDMNGDGILTITDVMLLINIIVGK